MFSAHRIQSFKFLGLPVLEIWLIFGRGVGDLDLLPFDL